MKQILLMIVFVVLVHLKGGEIITIKDGGSWITYPNGEIAIYKEGCRACPDSDILASFNKNEVIYIEKVDTPK